MSSLEKEKLRKFIFRIKNGGIPTLKSMEQFNINLKKINEIRNEAQLEPLGKQDIKGKFNNDIVEQLTKQEEEQDNIKKHGRPKSKTIFTIDKYIEELGKIKISPASQETYERMITILLNELGYTSGNIVPYLNKNFKHIQETINNIEQKRNPGELYSLGSKKIFYQAVSSGLYKNILPEFEKQMGKRATKWWNQEAAIITSDDRQAQRDKTINNEPINKDFKTYDKKSINFINDSKNNIEDRTFIQVYTQLGGIPRTNTFLNIHVVKNKNEANDLNKNYYITSTKTLISNNHKTGLNDGKEGGQAIEINLNKHPQILKNINLLSKQKNILFNMSQNSASILFKNILDITNRDLRKLYTTYVYNLPDEKSKKLIGKEKKIQAHSIDTAKTIYKIRRGGTILILG